MLKLTHTSRVMPIRYCDGNMFRASLVGEDAQGNLYALLDGPNGLVAWNGDEACDAVPCELAPANGPTDTHGRPLESRAWYAIGFRDVDNSVEWGPIYQYNDGEWFDDDGMPVEWFYDPVTQMDTADADAYMRQV